MCPRDYERRVYCGWWLPQHGPPQQWNVVAWGKNSQSDECSVHRDQCGRHRGRRRPQHGVAQQWNVIAWGDNGSGQINTPAFIDQRNLFALAAGYHHNLAIRTNGAVVAWELNVYGETTVPAG